MCKHIVFTNKTFKKKKKNATTIIGSVEENSIK